MSKLVYSSTDTERLQILKAFYEKLPVVEGEETYFTEEQLLKIGKYYSIFEKMKAYEDFLSKEQEKQDKEFNDLFAKARIFVNHYFATMQMAIERGELPATTANFYGLTFPFSVSEAESGDDLLKVAEALFNSDSMRIGTGGKYFANPSIGAVKVWVEKFKEVWDKKTNKFNVKKAEVEGIENIRSEADKLINNIFEHFNKEYSKFDYAEQTKLFLSWAISIEPDIVLDAITEEDEPIDIFFMDNLDEQKKDVPTEIIITPIEEKDESIEQKSNGGTAGINQLKFDLFFPER